MHDRYVTDILKMCMQKFNAEKIILTNLQDFDLHFEGVYCMPCLQPISCFSYLFINSVLSYEPRSEKTGLRGFRSGPIQTGLCSHRRWLGA